MVQKNDLLDMSPDELHTALKERGCQPFRAKQIWQWLYGGTLNFSEMSNLPQALRQELGLHFKAGGLTVEKRLDSKLDETRKYLFRLEDGNIIESVLMKYHYGYSVCLSTQVGCRMGCTFCASAPLGLVRNLTTGEMLAQILSIVKDGNLRVSHVVLMGIGEPFDNYDNVLAFLRRINREDTLSISYRKMTVSTCGIVPRILDFADEGIPVNLSVSLHAADDATRQKTMPVARSWPIKELLGACRTYADKTGRRVTYEYSLIKGVNDSEAEAELLSRKLKGTLCHVNLIPVNPVEGTGYEKSDRARIEGFRMVLERAGIAATVRRELGSDIMAACGQLRRNTLMETSSAGKV